MKINTTTATTVALTELNGIISRYRVLLNASLEGRELSRDLINATDVADTIHNAIRGLESAWKKHLDMLNSTEEGRKLSKELCELDSIMSDIELGQGEEGL